MCIVNWLVELSVLFKVFDFLEILGLDEGEELIDSFVKIVVDQAIGKEYGVVC